MTRLSSDADYAKAIQASRPRLDLRTIKGLLITYLARHCVSKRLIDASGTLGPDQAGIRTVTWKDTNPMEQDGGKYSGMAAEFEIDDRHVVKKDFPTNEWPHPTFCSKSCASKATRATGRRRTSGPGVDIGWDRQYYYLARRGSIIGLLPRSREFEGWNFGYGGGPGQLESDIVGFLTAAGVGVDRVIRSRIDASVEKSGEDDLCIDVDALISPYGR